MQLFIVFLEHAIVSRDGLKVRSGVSSFFLVAVADENRDMCCVVVYVIRVRCARGISHLLYSK